MGGGPEPYYPSFKKGDAVRRKMGKRVYIVQYFWYYGGTIRYRLDDGSEVDQEDLVKHVA